MEDEVKPEEECDDCGYMESDCRCDMEYCPECSEMAWDGSECVECGYVEE